jgi:hypothetical protein
VFKTPNQLKYRYARRLAQIVTKINNGTFFGFPAGSVKLLGARAKGHLFQTVPLDLEFEWKPNFKFSQSTETLADPDNDKIELMFDTYFDPFFPATPNGNLPGNALSGWNHVEYLYEKVPTADNKGMIQRPSLRIISEKDKYGDFLKLEL